MIPDPHDDVPTRPELASDPSVSCLVPLELGPPVIAVVLGVSSMFRATMPEATIREQDKAEPGKEIVGFSDKVGRVSHQLVPGKHFSK